MFVCFQFDGACALVVLHRSVVGLIEESLKPAEMAWGSHEKVLALGCIID